MAGWTGAGGPKWTGAAREKRPADELTREPLAGCVLLLAGCVSTPVPETPIARDPMAPEQRVAAIHAAAATNDQPKQTHFGGKSDGDAKDEAGGGGGGFGRADLQV